MSPGFDLEAEVRDLAARRDIYDVLCRYMRSQDRLLTEDHLSVFHQDGHVDCGIMNGTPTEFVDFAQGFLGAITSSHHMIGQAHIFVHGDTADGEVYFIAQHRLVEDGQEKDLIVGGRYVDRYECRDGVWKIATRKELIDWARTDPASDGFMSEIPHHARGARGQADYSQSRT